MTTLTAFYNGLADLSVTGVERSFAYPPAPKSINQADLPIMWVEVPGGEREPFTTCNTADIQLSATVVLLTQNIIKGDAEINNEDWLTLADNLITALRGADVALSGVTFSLSKSGREISDGIQYLAIEADCSATG